MGYRGIPGFLFYFPIFTPEKQKCFYLTLFFEALQVYNLIGLSHINADCGGQAEAARYFVVLVHNGPLMCFLSLKVPLYHSHIQGMVLLSCRAQY